MIIRSFGLAVLCMHFYSKIDGAKSEVVGDRPEKQFDDFVKTFKRVYTGESEKQKRFAIFENNLKEIKLLNLRQRKGTVVYGVTKFADLTREEFLEKHALKTITVSEKPIGDHYLEEFSSSPPSFNWVDQGGVTAALDEGPCQASFAYSAVAVVETFHFKETGNLTRLAVEHVILCGNFTCNSGSHRDAFQTILDTEGIQDSNSYDLHNSTLPVCTKNQHTRTRIRAIETVNHDEEGMKNFIFNNGPIAVAINSQETQFYVKGISVADASVCPPKPNRFVTLVGYGTERFGQESLPFWVAKNSYGEDWGEKGYYRFHRGSNYCGVKASPLSVTLDQDYKITEEHDQLQQEPTSSVVSQVNISTIIPTSITPKPSDVLTSTVNKETTTTKPVISEKTTTTVTATTQDASVAIPTTTTTTKRTTQITTPTTTTERRTRPTTTPATTTKLSTTPTTTTKRRTIPTMTPTTTTKLRTRPTMTPTTTTKLSTRPTTTPTTTTKRRTRPTMTPTNTPNTTTKRRTRPTRTPTTTTKRRTRPTTTPTTTTKRRTRPTRTPTTTTKRRTRPTRTPTTTTKRRTRPTTTPTTTTKRRTRPTRTPNTTTKATTVKTGTKKPSTTQPTAFLPSSIPSGTLPEGYCMISCGSNVKVVSQVYIDYISPQLSRHTMHSTTKEKSSILFNELMAQKTKQERYRREEPKGNITGQALQQSYEYITDSDYENGDYYEAIYDET